MREFGITFLIIVATVAVAIIDQRTRYVIFDPPLPPMPKPPSTCLVTDQNGNIIEFFQAHQPGVYVMVQNCTL